MLGYSPIAGSALASSGHEIIIVSLDHGSFAATGQAAGTNIALSDGFGTGSFAVSGQTVTPNIAMNEDFGAGSFAVTGQAASLNVSARS